MDAFLRLQKRLNNVDANNTNTSTATAASSSTSQVRTSIAAIATTAPEIVSKDKGLRSTAVLPSKSRPAQTWPVVLKSPREQVTVSVYHFPIAKVMDRHDQVTSHIYAWAFVSSGLNAVTNGEIVLLLQQRPNESPQHYPTDFLNICDLIFRRAVDKKLQLRRWQLIKLDNPIFGRLDFNTLALGLRNARSEGLKSLNLDQHPTPHFFCLAITDEERLVAEKCGVARILVTPFAKAKSPWFPFPHYVDRDRKEKLKMSDVNESILLSYQSNLLRLSGLNVIHSNSGQVTLHIPDNRSADFKAAIRKRNANTTSAILLRSEPHDSCQSIYYWITGQRTMVKKMDSAASSNIGTNFLLVSFNQPKENVSIVEDGIMVLLNAENTKRFFYAVSEGRDTTLSLDHTPFRLSWSPSWPVPAFTPFTGTAVEVVIPTSGGIRKQISPHVKAHHMVLVHLSQGATNHELINAFVTKAEAAISAVIPEQKPSILPGGAGMVICYRFPKISPKSFSVYFVVPSYEQQKAVPVDEVQMVLDSLVPPSGLVYGDYEEFKIVYSVWEFDWDTTKLQI